MYICLLNVLRIIDLKSLFKVCFIFISQASISKISCFIVLHILSTIYPVSNVFLNILSNTYLTHLQGDITF